MADFEFWESLELVHERELAKVRRSGFRSVMRARMPQLRSASEANPVAVTVAGVTYHAWYDEANKQFGMRLPDGSVHRQYFEEW